MNSNLRLTVAVLVGCLVLGIIIGVVSSSSISSSDKVAANRTNRTQVQEQSTAPRTTKTVKPIAVPPGENPAKRNVELIKREHQILAELERFSAHEDEKRGSANVGHPAVDQEFIDRLKERGLLYESKLDIRVDDNSKLSVNEPDPRARPALEKLAENSEAAENAELANSSDTPVIVSTLQQIQAQLSAIDSKQTHLSNEVASLRSQLKSGESKKSTATKQSTKVEKAEPEDSASSATKAQILTAMVKTDEAFILFAPEAYENVVTNLHFGSEITIEHRIDDWYRVILRNGTRGWIHSSALLFKPSEPAGKYTALRISGFKKL